MFRVGNKYVTTFLPVIESLLCILTSFWGAARTQKLVEILTDLLFPQTSSLLPSPTSTICRGMKFASQILPLHIYLGFGDSDLDDSVLVDEMMTVLKDNVKTANVLLLVLKGTETR